MAVLSLDGGRVFHIAGWGRHVGENVPVRAAFEDDGTFKLTKEGGLLNRTMVSAPADWVGIDLSTEMIQSGGGWVGGGTGLVGPLTGALQAQIMNRLTTRHREYVIMIVFAHLPDESVRELALGYLSESDLRAMLSEALPRWTELYVQRTLAELENSVLSVEDVQRRRAWLERVANHRMFSGEQLSRLADAYMAIEQAQHAPATREPDAPQRQLAPGPDPARELRRLASLRATGAISEEEFERRRGALDA